MKKDFQSKKAFAVPQTSKQTIQPQTSGGATPLSFGQQRMWFLQQLDPASLSTIPIAHGEFVARSMWRHVGKFVCLLQAPVIITNLGAPLPIRICKLMIQMWLSLDKKRV